MEQNIILAGVGGQGILTIARAIGIAAMRRGLQIKQAENHGMSQRGGAVESHLRLADHPIASDLVPLGRGDLVVGLDPLETLRYVQYLRPDGVIIASSSAFINISNYPPIEQVLERIAAHERHVFIDGQHLARAAGSGRAANMVALGAASHDLVFDTRELEDAIVEMFGAKGERVLSANLRAFRFGKSFATAYRDALRHGGDSRAVRHWLSSLPVKQLAPETPIDATEFSWADVPGDRFSAAEEHAFDRILLNAHESGRMQLYEHEVYTLVQLVGAIAPPRHVFLLKGEELDAAQLEPFPGERVVLKLVSPEIVHKSEAKAVRFVRRDAGAVNREIAAMVSAVDRDVQVDGVLVIEFVPEARKGFGSELFVGIRATREFGPVIAAGLGGLQTEYLAQRMRPRAAVAKAVASEVTAEEFLALFRDTAAYDVLLGKLRGVEAVVTEAELLRCFEAFILMARRFCVDRGAEGPDILELEVNPFAFREGRMVPLDGRGRMRRVWGRPTARPIDKVQALLEPKTIGVLGVSARGRNFGRIILDNLRASGFPGERLVVVKGGVEAIDGVRCVPDVAALPDPTDLLVVAARADLLPGLIGEIGESGKVRSAILIPGGVGETEGSGELQRATREAIEACRARPGGGPVFLGPNSMGVQSRPGGYDTFFIPDHKLDKRWAAPARRVALISQSGAFILSRLSNLEVLDPALALSIGNQADLTLADLLAAVARRDDIDAIGVYAEGFQDLDGLDFVRALRQAKDAGKAVVFYKAGRTESGRSAAAGHTAAVAGDYDVCMAAATQAGAIVVERFKDFEQLLELAVALHGKEVNGRRVGAISNAGFETVGMADTINGARYSVEMGELSEGGTRRLAEMLAAHGLTGLVNAKNPLDLTPMAGEEAYEGAIGVMLDSEHIDAVVVSVVPMSPKLRTTAEELAGGGSLAERVPALFRAAEKPLVFVVDAGPLYDPLAHAVRAGGVPVFRSADQAIRSLGLYLCSRVPEA